MPRHRLDDEEDLIPRSDAEEYHPTLRKRKSKCPCCSMKCWFFLFLFITLLTTIIFYFIYPSILQDNFQKLMQFACSYSTPAQVTCVVLSSQYNASKVKAVSDTWGGACSKQYYIYETSPENVTVADGPQYINVKSVDSIEPLVAINASDQDGWFLVTDDTSFVVMDKLQRLLANMQVLQSRLLADTLDTIQPPYLTTVSALQAITSGHKDNSTTVGDAVKAAGMNGTAWRLSGQNPTNIEDIQEIKNITSSFVFTDVSVRDMYAFHVLTAGDE